MLVPGVGKLCGAVRFGTIEENLQLSAVLWETSFGKKKVNK